MNSRDRTPRSTVRTPIYPWLVMLAIALFPQAVQGTMFFPMDISSSVNYPLPSYDHPPTGSTTLGGVPFLFPQLQVVSTRNIDAPTIALSPTVADSLYVLINTTNTFLYAGAYPGEVVGWLNLSFQGGGNQVVHLNLGENVREWRPANDCGETINTLTSPMARNVYSDTAPLGCGHTGSGPAVLDMLKIAIEQPQQDLPLQAIQVVDDSQQANGAWQPTIFVAAVTLGIEDLVPEITPTWGRIKHTFVSKR